MRWKLPQDDETRIVERFAVLPIRIRGEARWMERVRILQEYIAPGHSLFYGWRNIKFIDK